MAVAVAGGILGGAVLGPLGAVAGVKVAGGLAAVGGVVGSQIGKQNTIINSIHIAPLELESPKLPLYQVAA